MIRNFIFYIIVLILPITHCEEQFIRTDNHISSSACTINRQGLGQFERVQLTSYSIDIQFKNSFCPSISIHADVINIQTNKIERIIENIQTNNIFIDQLLPNNNYSITIKISDEKNLRILPAYIFQTLSSSNPTRFRTLSSNDLLLIDQIQSFIYPHTHIYQITLSSPNHRLDILGNIIISSKQFKYSKLVKPLDNNIISHLGRISKKPNLFFSIELPYENTSLNEYTSSIQLFYSNDNQQSIIDHPVIVRYPQPITVNFLSQSSRSMRVLIHHLCSSYIEIKAVIYNNSKSISRGQCDMNKNDNSLLDITNGQCTILFDKLQPEQNYTLSIRSTCPLGSSFIFYDQSRIYPFQTSSGPPDEISFVVSYHNHNKTLSWTNQYSNISYLGLNSYYELFTLSKQNWTLIYRGNQTQYQLSSKIIEKTNGTFRLYIANRYGRQEKNYSQININIDSVHHHHTHSNNQIVLFTILISVLLLILFGFIFLGCYLRNKKLYGKLKTKYYQNGDISDKELEHLRSLTYSNTLKDNILYTWSHTPTNIDLDRLPKIDRNMIKLDRLIGKGAFGEVYAGIMMNNQPVAIKTLLSSASPTQRVDFVKEAIIMNQFNHEHIVHLLGVCFHQDNQPRFLVIELMEQGDLQNFLRRSRPTKDNPQCQLSYEDCIDIARQIADGACYLEQHSYVHRDLAARNCLVSLSETTNGKILVKIGDFGLARMLSLQDYYRKTGEALLPVRWMAPESLLDALFTSHSDIWSFGIVLWEIITLGQVPYSPLNNQQVISLITTTRGTLEKPIQCTQTLYDLMLSCWNYIPENRINFLGINSRLNEILLDENKEQPSIWFNHDLSTSTARNVLDGVLNHIEPPTSISFEGSDMGECRSSTSGCFSSMTESTSQTGNLHHHNLNKMIPSYQLRLIDDTTSNDFADDDEHSDIIVRSF